MVTLRASLAPIAIPPSQARPPCLPPGGGTDGRLGGGAQKGGGFGGGKKYTFNFKKIPEYGYSIDPTDPAALNQTEDYYASAYTAEFAPLISGQRGAIQTTVMVNGRQYLLDEALESGLTCVYNFPETYDDFATVKYGDFMVRPQLSWNPGQGMQLGAGANLYFSLRESEGGGIESDPLTSFGMVDGRDHIFVEISYSF